MWHLIHHRRDQKLPRPPRGKDSALGMAERQRMERERLAERLKSYCRGKESGPFGYDARAVPSRRQNKRWRSEGRSWS
jgi:hypothetical protein